MDSRSRLRHFAHAALVSAAALAAAPAVADRVLLGSDYLATMAPTFLGLTALAGMPIGPGNTDTIVRRLEDCTLTLATNGSSCTIPIEMVALSLVGGGGMVRVRESPTLASLGAMTMISDGSGNGGSFSSFFDVFFELSFDGGTIWAPNSARLDQSAAMWSTGDPDLIVDGLMGDQDANRHTDKNGPLCLPNMGRCVDFRLVGAVTEQHPFIIHTAGGAVPEPTTLALLAAALFGLGLTSRRRAG